MLYLGEQPVPHAADAVAAARSAGMRLAFVTNNASRSPEAVAGRLADVGVAVRSQDVVTSAQAAARVALEVAGAGATVLVVGSPALAAEVAEHGLVPIRRLADAGAAGVAAVVQGLATQTTMQDLAEATVALRRGAHWVVGNTDATLPSPDGPLPGNGAFVDVLRATTGLEPRVAGKPDPTLHRESVERVGGRRPLVVGDRLETDILGAVRGGADSLLVLTGVTDVEVLLRAPRGCRPTYVACDLRGLLAAHPEVVVRNGVAQCREVTARFQGGTEVVRGQAAGRDDDVVRARAALAWWRADAAARDRHDAGRPVPSGG